MATKIKIKTGSLDVDAELNDSPTALQIAAAFPFEAEVNTWGDEIYFPIPVAANLAVPKETVEKRDIGYWPAGKAMCVFFGPTPMSQGDEIRPASAVDVVGKVSGDPTVFKQVASGDRIEVLDSEK